MPGFTSHYLFGVHMFHHTKDSNLKKIIKNNLPAYLLGLQGPDVFFYYLPCLLGDSKYSIGNLMHSSGSKEFFSHFLYALEHLESVKEREIATAYFSGFICHYTLDTSCHPFVYARTKYTLSKHGCNNKKAKKISSLSYLSDHIDYETNLDTLLLKKYKRICPSSFHQHQTIALNRMQRKVISRLLSYSIHKTYNNQNSFSNQTTLTPKNINTAILSMKYGCLLLSDRAGIKKPLLAHFENLMKKPHFISNLIPSNYVSNQYDYLNLSKDSWRSPWNNHSTENLKCNDTFLDLYHNAEKKCSHTLHILNQYEKCSYNLATYMLYKDNLLNYLGDYSYHSGMLQNG